MFSIISTIFGGHMRRNNNYDSNNNNNASDPLGLDIWDPFKDFPFNSNNNNSVFFSTQLSNETAQFANTRIDWKKTPEAHVFTANLPGIRKEEVKVEVEEGGRVLKISGQRKKVLEEKKDNKWHRMECSSGKFLHRFRLPENAMVDQMKVTMDNGVLIITIPKSSKVFEEK